MKNSIRPIRTNIIPTIIDYSSIKEIIFLGENNFTNNYFYNQLKNKISTPHKIEYLNSNHESFEYEYEGEIKDVLFIETKAFTNEDSGLMTNAKKNMQIISGETFQKDYDFLTF